MPYELMEQFFSSHDARGQKRLVDAIISEINLLLRWGLSPPVERHSRFAAVVDDLAGQIVAAGGTLCSASPEAGDTQLIRMLATDRQSPVKSFINDLSEILFLERDARSEYVYNTECAPPFKINKLLLEYATKSSKLDLIIADLTKDFCATQCDRLPVGCCSVLGYDLGLVPDAMLAVQEIEARRNGWTPPKSEEKCRYHTPMGCVLVLMKTPACIGMLCDALNDQLRSRFPPGPVENFLHCLALFRNSYIDRSSVFKAMDKTIAAYTALS